jgi:5'-methylthioadenosine phosphorylase
VTPVGIITGSGSEELELDARRVERVDTRFGAVEVARGALAGVEVLHVSRHGRGHARLSSAVEHRANVLALKDAGARCAVGLTICGAVDPQLVPGTLVVFDDLFFPANRLPDGSLCTLYPEPGDPQRGHWIFERPFAESVRRVLTGCGVALRDRGCYGHVDGPRFNSRAEIRALAAAGVDAVSQTGGPEAVLAGETELPYALVGYVTDYANGVAEEPTPLEQLIEHMHASRRAFAALLRAALPALAATEPTVAGRVYRWEQPR